MAYWWVNQGITYKEEKEGSFLWAPKQTTQGKKQHHWETMYQVQEGDIVFSYAKGSLRAFSSVIKTSYDYIRPFEQGNEVTWEREGNKINLLFNELKKPILLQDINIKLLSLLQNTYSPINTQGKVNQGYLYSVNDSAGKYLIDLIESQEKILINQEFEEDIKQSNLEKTTKQSIVESRIGQGEYRKNLIKIWKGKCAITDLDLTEVLIASHSKPWKYSNNQERLDPYNGLLLSPTYDKLFDKGYISFDQKGKILLSKKLTSKNIECLDINRDATLFIKPNKEQNIYLDFHRQNIFIC